MVYNLPVLGIFFLEQEVTTNLKDREVESFVGLDQSIAVSPTSPSLADTISLIQDVNVNLDVHLTVAHVLTLTQEQHARVYFENISHILIIAQDIFEDRNAIQSILSLSQTIVVDHSNHIDLVLEFVDTIGLSISYNLNVAQTLNMVGAANGYLPDECFINGDFTIMAEP